MVAPGWSVVVQYGSDFYIMNGTSYAAPLIAGLCALLLEAHPEWIPSDIMSALKYSARDLGDAGPDNDYGWGLPDAFLALNYKKTGIDKTLSMKNQDFILHQPYPNPFNQSLTISLTVYSESDVTIEIFDITGRRVSILMDNML